MIHDFSLVADDLQTNVENDRLAIFVYPVPDAGKHCVVTKVDNQHNKKRKWATPLLLIGLSRLNVLQ